MSDAVSQPVEGRARSALGAGSALLLLGLALVGIGPSDVGMAVTLVALVVTIYGIHTFGRLGPEEGPRSGPRLDESAPAVKRKKKKPADDAAETA